MQELQDNMKVFVGMSGGVDSSLTAALLIERGHNVTGVYMKNWSQDLPGMKCPWADDLADAKRVAVQLGIDLKVYDFEKEYRENVVEYMISAYSQGYTPNPDIMCNQEVKFKLFLETALADGADMIATGHYATTRDNRLFMASDANKDQTYFLYRVTSQALSKTFFPLGEYTKQKVRQMSEDRHLFTAKKKDSQGICFVGKIGIREFLSQYVDTKPGYIIDQKTGKKIGTHDGAIFYTIGQRHGLNIGGGLPYYVVGKNMQSNEVYVSNDINHNGIWRSETKIESKHWINNVPKDGNYLARIRHRAPLVKITLLGSKVIFDEPQRAIAPGQSVVIYDGEECLGGGIIV